MKINNIILSVVFFLLLCLSSCTDDFESINSHKYDPRKVSPEFLLSSAQSQIIYHAYSCDVNENVMPVQCQHFSQSSYNNESIYNFRDGLLNEYASNYYNALANLVDAEAIVNKLDESALSAAGKSNWNIIFVTLKAFVYQNLTDTYGPIMASKSFDVNNPLPGYDSQEKIYDDNMKALYKAVSELDESVAMPLGAQDLIYKSNQTLWKKFANSILLRYAMRIADVNPEKSKEYFNKAINENGGVFTSSADNAEFRFLDGPANNNSHFAETFESGIQIVASNTIIDVQNANKDPRLPMFWRGGYASGKGYSNFKAGLEYGKTGKFWNYCTVNRSLIGAYQSGRNDLPAIYMDYAEVEFFLAEAALRGGYNVTGTAKEHYDKAISASITYYHDQLVSYKSDFFDIKQFDANDNPLPSIKYSLSDTITKYLAQPTVNLDLAADTDAKLKLIGREKWIALFLQGTEAWAEARRLDSPEFNLPEDNVLQDEVPTGRKLIPTRLIFPRNELEINSKNVKEATTFLKNGKDQYTTMLWWDTK